jgi:hypothetical protein
MTYYASQARGGAAHIASPFDVCSLCACVMAHDVGACTPPRVQSDAVDAHRPTMTVVAAAQSVPQLLSPTGLPVYWLPAPATSATSAATPGAEINPFEVSFELATVTNAAAGGATPSTKPLNDLSADIGQHVAQAAAGRVTQRLSSMDLLAAASSVVASNERESSTNTSTHLATLTHNLHGVVVEHDQRMHADMLSKREPAKDVARERPRRTVRVTAKMRASNSDGASGSTISSDADSLSGSERDGRRERFLERNRIAAQRCRQRRKQRMRALLASTAELEHTHQALARDVARLKDDNYHVRALLLAHRSCPAVADPAMQALLTSVTRPSLPQL